MATQEVPKGGCRFKLLPCAEMADGTMAFHFERSSQFNFRPGQSADLKLSNPPETNLSEMPVSFQSPVLHLKTI